MIVLITLFFISLVAGQIGVMTLPFGVRLYMHDIVLFVVLLFVLSTKKHIKPKLFWPMVCWIGVAIGSLLLNSVRFSVSELIFSSLYLWRWVLYACVYYVVVATEFSPLFWLSGLYSIGTILGVVGLVQYVLYPDLRNLYYLGWDPHYYRVFSTLFDPNYLGIILVLTIYLGVYLWMVAKRNRLFLGVAQAIISVALLLTYSRSSFLALVAGAFFVVFIKKQWIIAVVGCMVFVCLLIFLPRPGGEGVRLERTQSVVARIGNWSRAITLIERAPLFGYGFNTLPLVGKGLGWNEDVASVPSQANSGIDNSFLFVWATTGILGLVVFIFLLWSLMQSVLSSPSTPFSLLLLSSLVAVIVHSQFINSLLYPWVSIWLWILWGAAEKEAGMSS